MDNEGIRSSRDTSFSQARPLNEGEFNGSLKAWRGAHGVIVMLDGERASRRNSRRSSPDKILLKRLEAEGFATLVIESDQNPDQKRDAQSDRWITFQPEHLAEQVRAATRWLKSRPLTADLPISYYSAGAYSAPVLLAAADFPEQVRSIVLRGGRPDLAREAFMRLRQPTLLIVGEEDRPVAELNLNALRELKGDQGQFAGSRSSLKLIPGAGHLFDEPRAIEEMTRVTLAWFQRFMSAEKTLTAEKPIQN